MQPCPGDVQHYAPMLYWTIEYIGSFLQTINLIVNVTKATSWGWRLSLGFAFVPSFFLFLGAGLHCGEPATLSAMYWDLKGCDAGGVFLPDSPNSLLERGFPEQVRTTVQGCFEEASRLGCDTELLHAGSQESRAGARHKGRGQRVCCNI